MDLIENYGAQYPRALFSVIAQTLNIPESRITDELAYQSIQEWDSLGHIDLMVSLERTFNIEISNDLVLKLNSIAAIREYIEKVQSKRTTKESQIPHVIEPRAGSSKRPIERGLKKVFFDRTEITRIDPRGKDLLFRGYSIHELAERSSFEETAYLVLHGDLPTSSELRRFDEFLRISRSIPTQALELIGRLTQMHPMHALRTVISALPAFASPGDKSIARSREDGLRLIAQVPTIVAAHHRIRHGQNVVAPNNDLSHAANFIHMMTGRHPTDPEMRHLEMDLLLHVDHSSTPSTFTARVAAGTEADIFAAISAAVAVFGGELHGGAPESVIRMLREIGSPENAATFVARKRSSDQPIMGFGHRIYRVEDPRARYFRDGAAELSNKSDQENLFATAEALVEVMRPYSKHGVAINDDFYSSIILHLLGIPEDLFGSIAIMSRVVGLVAHVIEQYRNNIVMAPSLKYEGEPKRTYVPIAFRNLRA